MTYTSDGYYPEDYEDIIIRLIANYKKVNPTLSFTPDDLLYQFTKIQAYSEKLIQQQIQFAYNNLSVFSASGFFLDRIAQEAGLFRKSDIYANGYVECLGVAGTGNIPIGTIFSTIDNKDYSSTTNMFFNTSSQLTRNNSNYDRIPISFYTALLDGLYTDATFTGIVNTGQYEYLSGNTVHWLDSGVVLPGQIYYALYSGAMGLDVPVQYSSAGIIGNCASNSIAVWNDKTYINSITNTGAIINGADTESDTNLRRRLLKAKRTPFGLGRIHDMVTQIDGVRECHVYQDTTVDRSILIDWTTITGFTGASTPQTGNDFGFSFYPHSGIATLQGITLHGQLTGQAPKLDIYLKWYNSGAYDASTGSYLAHSTFYQDSLERDNTGWQDITIPIKYNGLDFSKTFCTYFVQSGADANNHWEFANSGAISADWRQNTFNSGIVDNQLIYKTLYGSPSFTVKFIPQVGYDHTDTEDLIIGLLETQRQDGYSPICIGYSVSEATKLYMDLAITIYIVDGYSETTVKDALESAVTAYLDTLSAGDDIIYSQLEKALLSVAGIYKITNLEIVLGHLVGYSIVWGTPVTKSTQANISVGVDEYVELYSTEVTLG